MDCKCDGPVVNGKLCPENIRASASRRNTLQKRQHVHRFGLSGNVRSESGFENKTLEKNGFLGALMSLDGEIVYFDAFTRAFGMCEASLSMSAEAKDAVRAFGAVIGKSDREEQLMQIDRIISEMTEICKKTKVK